jgi:hypothetical protein
MYDGSSVRTPVQNLADDSGIMWQEQPVDLNGWDTTKDVQNGLGYLVRETVQV